MDARDTEQQTFDPQPASRFLTKCSKICIGDEYRSNLHFDDTVVLRSPSVETQVENLGGDTEIVDIPRAVEDMETQLVDNYEEEVVLDSDDERVPKIDPVSVQKFLNEPERTSEGGALDSLCLHNEELVVRSVASARKLRCVGYPQCGNKLSEAKSEAPEGEKDCVLPTFEHGASILKCNESEETGESSQDNALGFVDRYLSFNKLNLSEEEVPTMTRRQKSPPVSASKGLQSLARRASLGTAFGMSRIFDLNDNQMEDVEGCLLKKRKDLILNSEESDPRSLTRPQRDRILNVPRQRNLDLQCTDKLQGSLLGINSKNVGEAVQLSDMKLGEEIDDQLNPATSGQQLGAGDTGGDSPDLSDVGFDTQMAAEAMEALFYAPPPTSNAECAQDPENMIEVLSEGVATARQLKQTNRPSKKLRVKVSSSFKKYTKKKKELDPESSEANKAKRVKPLAKNPFNSWKRTRGSSHKVSEQGREDQALDRDNIKEVNKIMLTSISAKQNSLGVGPVQGECKTSSPIASRTRRCLSVYPLKKTEDPINISVQKMGDIMESGLVKKRRKSSQNADTLQAVSCRGKHSKVGLHTSEEAKILKVGQQEQQELDVDPAGSHWKLDVWSHPRGKRKHCKVPCPAKEVSDIRLSTWIERGKSNGYSTENPANSLGTSETSCFSLDVTRKPRSSGFDCQVRPILAKKLEDSFLRLNSDEQCSADAAYGDCAVRNENIILSDSNKVKASWHSGELKYADSVSADDAKENLELEVLSFANSKESLMDCPNLTVDKGCKKGKQLCNKNPLRFPLFKELNSLGTAGSLANFASKDLRSRRDMTKVRILFSQNMDDDIIKQQKKILTRLGSSVASGCSDATHFVADRFVRTRNMLEAIALGKPVVTHLWLDSCGQASCFIHEKNYILRDDKKEKQIGFSMPVSLAHARRHPLLKGRRFFITPNIKPGKELIASLVKAVEGLAVDIIQRDATKDTVLPDDLLVLSCEQDYALCAPFLKKGKAVYSSELLLNGIIVQKLEFERHQLFKNNLRSACSPTGPKKGRK